MNDKFDELAKGLAQSVTRRGALKKFGVGLAGIALASLGLASKARANPGGFHCQCKKADYGCSRHKLETVEYLVCINQCGVYCSQLH